MLESDLVVFKLGESNLLHHVPGRAAPCFTLCNPSFCSIALCHHTSYAMVHFYKSLSEDLRVWALQQQMFFIASAPLNGQHVNLSPKGLIQSTFHIFDSNHAAYLDTAGSGVETISHIYENKRATLMFCSLDGKPRIMRLFCTGSVVERTDSRFSKLMQSIGQEEFPGIRAIIMLEIFKVGVFSYAWFCLKKGSLLKQGSNLLRLRCAYTRS